MVIKEHVKEAWKRFKDLEDHVGQHLFIKLILWEYKLAPLYEDLLQNWNALHAEAFLQVMDALFKSFGMATMEEWRRKQCH